MEEVLADFTGQARKSAGSQNAGDFGRPPKHTSLNKNLIRKKSVLTLAAELFKPKKEEKVEVPTHEQGKQGSTRVPWNSFVSLRGFRESKKRASIFGTARCRSSSPQKMDELVIDEFGMPKPMRRKSLQDLLGTVRTKLLLPRPLVYSEDSIPQTEAPLEAMAQFQMVSPLVLPEPALPLPGSSNAVLGLRCHYSKDSTSNEAPNSHKNLEISRHSEEASFDRPKLRTKPSLRIINAAAQPGNAIDRPSPAKTDYKSQEQKYITPSPSPEKLRPAATSDYLRDVCPQIPTRVRFLDEEDPPQYRYSDDFVDTIAPESADLDPSFPERALSRGARYNTIYGGPGPKRMESSTKGIERLVALTAAKTSNKLHLSTNQSRWSADSSETSTDDMSDYGWVEKEMEVQNIIDRGKEIMTLGTLAPHLHSSSMGKFRTLISSVDLVTDKKVDIMAPQGICLDAQFSSFRNNDFSPRSDSHAYPQEWPTSGEDWMSSASYVMCAMASEERQPELPSSKGLAIADDELQGIDEVKTQTFRCNVGRGRKRMISLENGERFRPRLVKSRIISGEPVHIVYPSSEFCAGHTKTYTSKRSAFGDLYQNHCGFSDYCLFDRSTGTYYPQTYSGPVPELPKSNAEILEVLWLPLELLPADSFTGQFDKGDVYPNPSKNRVSEVGGPLSCTSIGLPNPDSSSLQASDFKCLETEVLNEGEIPASISSFQDSAYSEQGSGVGYSESAPHLDMVGMSSSNDTMAVISTREVASFTTGSVISEDLQPKVDEMDDSYEISVDSATARRYLGSLFSSTESLQSIAEDEVDRSRSANSILCKLKDVQPEDAKYVKTWIEMEREFMDRFAPGSHMFPDRRRRVAVYEAFKKLKGLADLSDDDTLNSSRPECDTEHKKWMEYREAYMGFSFGHVEDIADCGSINEEPAGTTGSPQVRESANLSHRADPGIIVDARDKGKQSFKTPHHSYAPLAEVAISRDHFGDTLLEEQAAYSESSTAEGMSKSHNSGAGGTDGGQQSNIIPFDSHIRLGSEAYSDTSSTAITMLSGYMFTHYAEQLGECPVEAHGEEQQHCVENHDCQSILSGFSSHATDVTPNVSVFGNASIPLPTGPHEIDAGVESDTDQLNVWPKDNSFGLARTITVQLCPPRTRVGLAALFPGRSASLNAGCFNSVETLKGHSPPGPRFPMRNRVPTPKKRVPSPLTEFSPQNKQKVRYTSPSPSDAGTEVSENFGQKLKRYKRIEEEDKENDFWWSDSISYG